MIKTFLKQAVSGRMVYITDVRGRSKARDGGPFTFMSPSTTSLSGTLPRYTSQAAIASPC